MAETQKMWSRRHNRSNKRTDLAYCIAWSKHGLRPVKSRHWPLKDSSTEATVELGIGDAIYRWPVMSIYAPSNAHHSPMVRCTPRRFEVISSGSIGLVIHPVTSRLRTLGRAIGSGASTRLASETCCCSLVGRTNRLVALSSKPVLHWRQGGSCSSSRLALRRSRTTPRSEERRVGRGGRCRGAGGGQAPS